MQEHIQEICSTMRALVIDDDRDTVNFVSAVLKDMKVQTIWTAFDGNSGLDIFRQVRNQVDLIICDWMMPPGMSGLDILRDVRHAGSSVLFLMVTARVTPKAVTLAGKLGVDAFVKKPLDPLEFRNKIVDLVKKLHAESELAEALNPAKRCRSRRAGSSSSARLRVRQTL